MRNSISISLGLPYVIDELDSQIYFCIESIKQMSQAFLYLWNGLWQWKEQGKP